MKKLFPYLLSAACLYACWFVGILFLDVLALCFHFPLSGNTTAFTLVPLLGLQVPISSFTQYSFWCTAFGWLLVGVPLVFFRQKLAFVFNPKYSFGWGIALSIVFTFIALEIYPYPVMRYMTLASLYTAISFLLQGQTYILPWLILGMIGYLFSVECYGPAFIGGLSLWSFSWIYNQENLSLRLSRSLPFYVIGLSILIGSTLFLYWYGGVQIVGHLTGLWPGTWAKGQMMLYFSDLAPPSR